MAAIEAFWLLFRQDSCCLGSIWHLSWLHFPFVAFAVIGWSSTRLLLCCLRIGALTNCTLLIYVCKCFVAPFKHLFQRLQSIDWLIMKALHTKHNKWWWRPREREGEMTTTATIMIIMLIIMSEDDYYDIWIVTIFIYYY